MLDEQTNKKLQKAAREIAKDIDAHFKSDKWPLDFGFQVEEVFYQAFGLHLERFLILELRKRNCYSLELDERSKLVICKPKKFTGDNIKIYRLKKRKGKNK